MLDACAQQKLGVRTRSRHDELVQVLDALAQLIGCTEGMGGWLPDGLCPDVIRLDRRQNVLFIGDAKDTETPGNKATQCRLQGYARWLATFVNRSGNTGLFALCVDNKAEVSEWTHLVRTLGLEVGSDFQNGGVAHLADAYLVWAVARPKYRLDGGNLGNNTLKPA